MGFTVLGAVIGFLVATAAQTSARIAVGLTVLVAGIGFLVVTAMQTSAVYYLTVSELKALGQSVQGQPVRVAGHVADGSIQRDPTSFLVQFDATDASGRLPVTYRGVLPDIFGDGVEVVVEGRYGDDGVFVASTLLAKCPSKFETAPGGPAQDRVVG